MLGSHGASETLYHLIEGLRSGRKNTGRKAVGGRLQSGSSGSVCSPLTGVKGKLPEHCPGAASVPGISAEQPRFPLMNNWAWAISPFNCPLQTGFIVAGT